MGKFRKGDIIKIHIPTHEFDVRSFWYYLVLDSKKAKWYTLLCLEVGEMAAAYPKSSIDPIAIKVAQWKSSARAT